MIRFKEILLIDDSEIDNFVHETVLQKMGIADTISTATNGQDALDYLIEAHGNAQKTVPELIFLDINMPVMDGWEFAAAARREGVIADSVVVMMLTTSQNPDDRARAEAEGYSQGFLTKPLTAEAVEELLVQHFGM